MRAQHLTQLPTPLTPTVTETDAVIPRLLKDHTIWPGEASSAESTAQVQHYYTPALHTVSAIPFHLPEIDSFLPCGGLQHNAIHEILYSDPLQPKAVAQTLPTLLAYNAHMQWQEALAQSTWRQSAGSTTPICPSVIWIGKRCWPTPSALIALTAPEDYSTTTLLQHSLFIDPPNDTTTLWAIETALRSPAVRLVVATCPRISRTTTQRLALAARTHSSTAILLRAYTDIILPSCATSRWVVTPTPSDNNTPCWELTLTKLKGHGTHNASWILGIHEDNFSISQTDTPRAHAFFASRLTPPLEETPNQTQSAQALSL
jgi:hypothetical protein